MLNFMSMVYIIKFITRTDHQTKNGDLYNKQKGAKTNFTSDYGIRSQICLTSIIVAVS